MKRIALPDLRGLVLPIAALVAWDIAAHQGAAHAYVFVPLEQVAVAAWEGVVSGDLAGGWLASLVRTAIGFAVGATLGIALGAVMATWRIADALINPVYQAVRQVPLLGFIPLISLWFGNDEPSKLLVVSLAAFYPTVLNTYEGLRGANIKHLDVGRLFLASRWQAFRYIILPGALPAVFTGLMQAVAFAWLSSIGSELFFDPGPGLGNLMLNGQAAFRMDVVLVAVILIGVTGYLSNAAISLIAARVLRWRPVR
jgi:sulfonate transport system permease protein